MKKKLLFILFILVNNYLLVANDDIKLEVFTVKPIIDETDLQNIIEAGNALFAYIADEEKTSCLVSDGKKLKEAFIFLEKKKKKIFETMIKSAEECFKNNNHKACAEFAFNQSHLIDLLVGTLANTKELYEYDGEKLNAILANLQQNQNDTTDAIKN